MFIKRTLKKVGTLVLGFTLSSSFLGFAESSSMQLSKNSGKSNSKALVPLKGGRKVARNSKIGIEKEQYMSIDKILATVRDKFIYENGNGSCTVVYVGESTSDVPGRCFFELKRVVLPKDFVRFVRDWANFFSSINEDRAILLYRDPNENTKIRWFVKYETLMMFVIYFVLVLLLLGTKEVRNLQEIKRVFEKFEKRLESSEANLIPSLILMLNKKIRFLEESTEVPSSKKSELISVLNEKIGFLKESGRALLFSEKVLKFSPVLQCESLSFLMKNVGFIFCSAASVEKKLKEVADKIDETARILRTVADELDVDDASAAEEFVDLRRSSTGISFFNFLRKTNEILNRMVCDYAVVLVLYPYTKYNGYFKCKDYFMALDSKTGEKMNGLKYGIIPKLNQKVVNENINSQGCLEYSEEKGIIGKIEPWEEEAKYCNCVIQ